MGQFTAVGRSAAVYRGGPWLRPALLLLTMLAFALRTARLDWQPLWWDEGYSVFFATEPLVHMAALTALDIHPPLYYSLLHGWIQLLGSARPELLRLFSAGFGLLAVASIGWLARLLLPHRPGIGLWATLLLAVSPMHIFYSQEVRMYSLELLLGLLSTGFFWRLMSLPPAAPAGRWLRPTLLYALTTAAALYTAYYAALLPLAHGLWALWRWRRQPVHFWSLLAAVGTIALLYLPWLLYAAAALLQYVTDKVVADQDLPLTLGSYAGRHLLAFAAGHLPPPLPGLTGVHYGGMAALAAAMWVGGWRIGRGQRTEVAGLLVVCLMVPFLIGYLVNLGWPFFPDGGERVLFFVLPYALLLAAAAWPGRRGWPALLAVGLLGLLLLAAAAGIGTFFSVPRYSEDDYRPLVASVTERGTDQDTVLAIFPWQVGFWRAYGPVYAPLPGSPGRHGPWPHLLGPGALAWNSQIAAQIDGALQRGTVWLPALLSIGSTLPAEMEDYLGSRSVNVADGWVSVTTHISAWQQALPLQPAPQFADFGPITLVAAATAPLELAAANQVVQVALTWAWAGDPVDGLRVVVRLVDETGRVWASRDYGPPGSMAQRLWDRQSAASPRDQIGLQVPVGLAPARYTVRVGVSGEGGALLPLAAADGTEWTVPVGELSVVRPDEPLPPLRLPGLSARTAPLLPGDLALFGYSGYRPEAPPMAGTDLELLLFVQSRVDRPPRREMAVQLQDAQGHPAAAWQGWYAQGPLAGYPTDRWQSGDLLQLPVSLPLPAQMAAGSYRLVAGLVESGGTLAESGVELDRVDIWRRPLDLSKPVPAFRLQPMPQLGTHVLLAGYDLTWIGSTPAAEIELTLYWQVLDTLRPPHNVYVHLDAPDGRTLAQDDRAPTALTADGGAIPAPTGSWLAGETVRDRHRVGLTAPPPPGSVLLVGLYYPQTGQRLPVSLGGQTTGDGVAIPLSPVP